MILLKWISLSILTSGEAYVTLPPFRVRQEESNLTLTPEIAGNHIDASRQLRSRILPRTDDEVPWDLAVAKGRTLLLAMEANDGDAGAYFKPPLSKAESTFQSYSGIPLQEKTPRDALTIH
jgi:hypothetical protein